MNQLIVFLTIFTCLVCAQIYWNIEFPKQLKIRENAGDLWEETKDYRFLSNFGKRLKTSWVIFAVTGLAFLFGFFWINFIFYIYFFLSIKRVFIYCEIKR